MFRHVIVFNTFHRTPWQAAAQKKNPELSEILNLTEAYEAIQNASHIMKDRSNAEAEVNFVSKEF